MLRERAFSERGSEEYAAPAMAKNAGEAQGRARKREANAVGERSMLKNRTRVLFTSKAIGLGLPQTNLLHGDHCAWQGVRR